MMAEPITSGPSAPAPALPTERTAYLRLNGLRILCREWGDNTAYPVILLHGLRGYSATWRGLAGRLRSTYRLIAIDQRGRGRSDWDPELNYYTDSYVADLEALVDELKLSRFALLGHSMGGTTAYAYAARYPRQLSALIIEDIAPGSSTTGAGARRIFEEITAQPEDFASWSEARAYWYARRPTLPAAALEERLVESLRCGRDRRIRWRHDAEGIKRTRLAPDPRRVIDLWPVLEAIRTPTLIIRGEKSDFCAESTLIEACRRNPRLSSVVVSGASHYVHDDNLPAFADCVQRFLARHVEVCQATV